MAFDIRTIAPKLLAARPAKEGKNILSPICRLSYPHLFVKVAVGKDEKGDKKYSCSLLIPPQCDITLLKKAAGEAAAAKFGDKVAELKASGKLKSPFLRAGDYKHTGELAEWTLMRPSSTSKPSVLEPKGNSFIKLLEDDPELVYPGRWASVSLNFFGYDTKGNKGVSVGLNNVVLLNHDDSLSGRAMAEEEFDADIIAGDYSSDGKDTPKSLDDVF